MPEMEITAGVTVRPLKNLSASLDYYLATGRETCVSLGQDLKMDNINELNLTGAYNFNDTFGLYLKLNNVLFQKYELYYGYPLQKFSAIKKHRSEGESNIGFSFFIPTFAPK